MFPKIKMVDSLQNLLTGLGVSGMDKSVGSEFHEVHMSAEELDAAYSSDWLSGKVCNLPPFDMTREWRKMTGSMDADMKTKFMAEEKRLNLREKIKDAMTWGRLYGGAGIIINADDGNLHQPWFPIDISQVKKEGLKYLIVSDRQFLHTGKISHSPLEENYGFPETYRIAPSSTEIHHSRVCRFEGVKLPLSGRRRNQYWGKSYIEHMSTVLKRAAEAQESVGALLHESTVDIIKVTDLMHMLSNPESEAQLRNRFSVAKMQKSMNRMLLLDADEEYITNTQQFTGIVEIIEKMLSIAGGAADIPITRLLGTSPGGMSSTGESDIRNYYDHLSARQEVDLRPKLEYLDRIIFASLFGREAEDGELDFEFNPLWQMSEKEKAELELNRSQRDTAYLASGVLNQAIVAKDLMEDNTYSGVDSKYVKELEDLIKEPEEFEPDEGL